MKKKQSDPNLMDEEKANGLFEKVEEMFKEYYGKRCSDFEPFCAQCAFWLDFNTFKRKVFEKL